MLGRGDAGGNRGILLGEIGELELEVSGCSRWVDLLSLALTRNGGCFKEGGAGGVGG